jgi:hypothetical protein
MRSMNIALKPFQSMSDTVIKLSIAPGDMKDGLTISDLKNYYIQNYEPLVKSEQDEVLVKYKNFQARFTVLQEARTVGSMRKFFLIFARNLLFLRRNPKIIIAIFINSVYFGLVLVAIFFNIGNRKDGYDNVRDIKGVNQYVFTKVPSIAVWIGNWVGVA